MNCFQFLSLSVINAHICVFQSLLSSDLPSSEDRSNVLKFATANPSALGAQSLKILCIDRSQQLDYILHEFPYALLQFGKVTKFFILNLESIV